MSETIARAFESTMQACLVAKLPAVYRAGESIERLLPCVVLKASSKGEELSIRFSGRYAESIEFRATCIVSNSAQDSARALEELAAKTKTAIETANIVGGWNYLHLDLTGDDRAIDNAQREYTHIYTVTAHRI